MRNFKLLFTLLSLVLIGSGGLLAQPANDLCDDAQVAMDGDVFNANTTTATGTGFPGHTEGQFGGFAAGDPGVWYEVSGVDGFVTANTCGSAGDTRISVFSGSCAELFYVNSNDDFCGLQSQVSFVADPANTYYIYLSGFGGATFTNANIEFAFINDLNPGSDDVGYFTRNNAFERIELANGNISTVGIMSPNPGFVSAGEITEDGIYYAFDNTTGNLITIDTGSAAVTVVGPLAVNAGEVPTVLQSDPNTGTMYAVAVDGATLDNSSLYTVDVTTGAATFIGNSPVDAIIAMGISEDGNAYGLDIVADVIYEFDLSDFSVIAGPTPITDMDGTPIDINFGQDVDFDFTPGNNFLYGILFDNVQGARRFGVLDPVSGMFTDIPSPLDGGGANVGSFSILGVDGGFQCDGEWTVDLSAINNVNVTLDENCTAKLTARQVLVGDFDTDDEDGENDPAPDGAFEIVVQDSDPSNGNVIDGCGTFIWTAVPFCPDSVLMGFTTAWGYVNAEDKISPVLVDSLEPRIELFCTDLPIININELPASVSRCWIQDGETAQTLNNSMNADLRNALLAGGGVPNFFDGCSDVEICVNDLVQNNGQCVGTVITRVFTATDGLSCTSVSGEENEPTVYSYDIEFTVPSANDVVGVDSLVEFSCSENFPTLPANTFGDENPAPQPDDFPFLERANGMQVFLSDQGFCNLGAAFQDGPRIQTCENTYKFVRTFTVIDWCDVNNTRTFSQLVKVGDFEAPTVTAPTQDLNFDGIPDQGPLFFSTNTANCTAVFVIPVPGVTDNCDATPTVTAVIYPGGDFTVAGFGPFTAGTVVGNEIPKGDHVIRYFAEDNCGNVTTLDRDVTIGDQTAPVAICEDGLNVSIGGPTDANGGTAELCAEDVNRASYDDCSDILLEIRVTEINGIPVPFNSPLNVFQECHTLTCDQLGTIEVELRVTDDANMDGMFQFGIDNSNTCWLDVLVEDKLAPICIAPPPVTVTCADLAEGFPQDLNVEFATDPIGTAALLDAQFGAATGLDNCPNPVVTQTVVDTRNSCGVGAILRSFTVTDAQMFTSAPGCTQTINVLGVHDYTIVFPADEETSECVDLDYNAVTYTENGCDLIAVSPRIDTFTATADECYKLRVTYEVINWCEYNTIDPAYEIPRDADNDGNLNEETYLHVLPFSENTLSDDQAWLDRDDNRTNGFIDELDTGDGGLLPGSNPAGYGQDDSRGAFIYRQFIKVYDNNPPTLVITPEDDVCDVDGDCVADVELEFSITDECSPASVNADVALDVLIPAGTFTLADFTADVPLTATPVDEDGNFVINIADAPIGRHAVRIRATDGCGNIAVDLIIFEVIDCKAPTPICINGLTATLMPDGDGGGMAAIWASDFIASPNGPDCSGEVCYAIYRDGEEPASPMCGDTGLILTCADEGPVMVRIYAIDPSGQSDYCLTMLLVQAFADNTCTGPGEDGSLAGNVATPSNVMMDGVEVNISNDAAMNNMELTTNGLYAFEELPLGDDYTIDPSYNPDVNLNNVSTGDLIMISRHILDIADLTGEYQLLAADVNLDGSINILDIIAIRRVILGLDATFPATDSWNFYVAGDDTHAEVYTENNLAGNITGIDFVAVEMGNVSDALANFAGTAEARGAEGIVIEDVYIRAGENVTISMASKLLGFQGTLELGAGIEFIGVNAADNNATAFNLNEVANGLIAFSDMSGEGFELEVRATTDVKLSEVLSLGDRITTAEAYTTNGAANLSLEFTTATAANFELGQNVPNPVVDRTQINFNLPAAATATLTVQDVQGRVVLVKEQEAAAGANFFEFSNSELQGATGVLTYTLVAGDYTATRKMVVVK